MLVCHVNDDTRSFPSIDRTVEIDRGHGNRFRSMGSFRFALRGVDDGNDREQNFLRRALIAFASRGFHVRFRDRSFASNFLFRSCGFVSLSFADIVRIESFGLLR